MREIKGLEYLGYETLASLQNGKKIKPFSGYRSFSEKSNLQDFFNHIEIIK